MVLSLLLACLPSVEVEVVVERGQGGRLGIQVRGRDEDGRFGRVALDPMLFWALSAGFSAVHLTKFDFFGSVRLC